MIHTIQFDSVTVFCIQGERSILVDCGHPGHEERIIRELESQGIGQQDISLIVVTHGHHDHFGAAAALKKWCQAPVAAHSLDRSCIEKGLDAPITPFFTLSKALQEMISEKAGHGWPGCPVDIELGDGYDLTPWGVSGRIMHTPGHSGGAVSIVLADGTCLVGDCIVGTLANALVPNWPLWGQDFNLLLDSVGRLLETGAHTWYASHGGPFSQDRVRTLLRTTQRR